MRTFNQADYLDDQLWSPLWERYLKQAVPFDPLNTKEISMIVPIPEQTGVLIFSEKTIYHSDENGLTVLKQYSAAHGFPHYKLVCTCLKTLPSFGSYKFPWLCLHFSLFPLENTQRTIWMNPLKISQLHYENDRYYAEMLTTPNVALPILKRSFFLRTELALYSLALFRHDVLRFHKKADTPLAYLELPDTFFARQISQRHRLSQFSHRIGEFTSQYNRTHFLHYYDKLVDDPHKLDWNR
ncbi:hypothetical protein ACWOCJ_11815 [Enterococcus pseudoavium]|uniref:hypothetical protein n=1 Tax=Enterococcus pseudoavium TaxID=44007 RepID=UPI00082C9C42|nr:hypothetical protein [Enterococcus pseudoavium]